MKKSQISIIVATLILYGVILGIPTYQRENQNSSQVSSPIENVEKQPKYIVRVYQGVLAVYRTGQSSPWKITDIRLASLKEYDRNLMEKGLALNSDSELAMFLEDFGS